MFDGIGTQRSGTLVRYAYTMSKRDRTGSNRRGEPPQVFLLRDRQIALPEGVSVADWSLEKTVVQNPRIRSLLGCIRLLESVLDSNYAILHCSPGRLLDVWSKVRNVAELIRSELRPLLSRPSCLPELEEERATAAAAAAVIESTVLRKLAEFPADLELEQMMPVRKLLCVSIGKLHAFLQDTFSRIVAADPRSEHSADYFLSRRFPHDVEEAEWLFASVKQLNRCLAGLNQARVTDLTLLVEKMVDERMLPASAKWKRLLDFLDRTERELVPELKQVLSLRGIRFDEMEILDHYASEIPVTCRLVREVGDHARAIGDQIKKYPTVSRTARESTVSTLMVLHGATARKLSGHLTDLDRILRDLAAFLPFWVESIGRRRALMLSPHQALELPASDMENEIADTAPDNDSEVVHS